MNSLASHGGSHRSWHTDSDVGTRRMIAENILLIFEKRKPQHEWQHRLPELVKRLEESLYRDASSKEEYADVSTLEQRLHAIVKRGQARSTLSATVRGGNASSSSNVPTPGVSASLNGSTMIPTPGAMNANPHSCSLGKDTPSDTMMSIATVNNMVPTPGVNSNMLTCSNSSTVRAGNPMMSGTIQLQQQVYNPSSNGIMGGNGISNMQRKFPYMSNSMSTGTLNFPNPPLYAVPQFGNLIPQNPLQTSKQRHQNMPIQSMGSNHLAPNAAESASLGSYYNPISNGFGSSRLNMHTQNFQTSKMIPVPGLMSDQSSLQSQKQVRQPQSEGDKFMPVISQPKSTMGNQQQKEPIATRISFGDVKSPPLSVAHSQQELQLTKIVSNDLQCHTTGCRQPSEECHNVYTDLEKEKQQFSSSLVNDNQLEMGKKMQQCDQEQVTEPSRLQETTKTHPQQKAAEEARELDGLSESVDNGISVSQVANTAGNVSGKPLPTGITDSQKAQLYLKQQRWLLILRHASKCTAPEGQCQLVPQCHTARQLCMHITKCRVRDCQYARCQILRTLVMHHQNCRDAHCPVCGPVRQKMALQRMKAAQSNGTTVNSAAQSNHQNVSQSAVADSDASSNKSVSMPISSLDVQVPSAKRLKLEQTELVDNTSASKEAPKAEPNQPTPNVTASFAETSNQVAPHTKSEVSALMNDQVAARNVKIKSEQGGEDIAMKQIPSNAVSNKPPVHIKQEVYQEKLASPVAEYDNTTKGSKSKIKGVSLTELFTPEQIKEHIRSLRQWVGQSKAKAEKNQAMEHQMNDSSCQLCAVETLRFDPPPIYCTPCGARIKRNAFYWTMQIGETRHYVCVPCYNDPRAETVDIDGVNFSKLKLEKRKNDEEIDEPWVQCDKCEKWQHQVCALFNMRRNEGGQAEYICPHCLIREIEQGERKPLPQSAVLGAKDLPKTLLSDHIEQRLLKKLKQERHERARVQGKSFDEVPGVDSLVARIVSSVDKKLEVKQQFFEMFQSEGYPSEFSYKSKVLLLFQKIEGVEVCLFGMYVQEFGTDAAQPNQRRVYLSYLDSVKYFRPDVKTIHGEALRTFVYHEILIGYLEYCKKRGFTSCYIWACPPLKGEDYILYCHPEIQKTPKSDKLREWYLSMLRKASNENIVVELTNMYDHFFTCAGEAKAEVTATRLPYFDGDYWPGAAEDMIMQLQEEEIERRQQKKGKIKKLITKRAAKTGAQPELTCNASKDLQLMNKLGETIYPMKEDFIMVHLQFCCTHCCNFILSGRYWICKQCKDFHICDRCYDAEQKRDERERHTCDSDAFHPLVPVERTEPVNDTKDKDEIVESEFFDTRQAFLSLCQGNHYQYDTLRRAKHSSMMVLYHLHNPTAPAFVTTCNKCHHDIETGQGWRCETCPDFDLCNSCYCKDDSEKHPHKLTPHPSAAEREAQSKEARQQRVLQLRKMLDLLVHASQCGSAQCLYPNCRRVKGLFRHGICCNVRASGGCHLCKKMWYLLQLHARACKESECRVPRCKDLKEHLRRLQQQMESRRRAAVKEMMRQRTAEAATGTR